MDPVVVLKNGVRVPRIGLGTFTSEGGAVMPIVEAALTSGYSLIDTATYYNNEGDIGSALAKLSKKRPELIAARAPEAGATMSVEHPYPMRLETGNAYNTFITTKVWPDMLGGQNAMKSAKHSMSLLGVEKIDLLMAHWPVPNLGATSGPSYRAWRHDAWRSMELCMESGLARAIGVCNFNLKHLTQLLEDGVSIEPMMNQVELHPQFPRHDIRKFCADHGIAMTAFGSLGSRGGGLLNHEVVLKIAERVNKGPGQVLLRWAYQQGICVIPGSSNPARIAANLDITSWTLTEAEIEAINRCGAERPSVWYPNSDRMV